MPSASGAVSTLIGLVSFSEPAPTGHGTLGWTHSCGSGKSIARIIGGLKPEVDFAFTGS